MLSIRDSVEHLFTFLQRKIKTIFVLLMVSIISAVICKNPFGDNLAHYVEGGIATRDIIAPSDLKIVDADATDKRRALAVQSVLPVYDLDPESKSVLLERIKKSVDLLESTPPLKRPGLRTSFEETLQAEVSQNQWLLLQEAPARISLRKILTKIVKDLGSSWLIDDSISPEVVEISLRDIRSSEEFKISRKAFERKALLLSDVRDQIRTRDNYLVKDSDLITNKQWEELRVLASNLLEVDLSYNQVETKARKQEALSRVEPIWIEIPKGQPIIREGEKFERRHIIALAAIQKKSNRLNDIKSVLFFAAFLFLLIQVFYFVGRTNFKKFKLTFRDQWVISLLFVSSLGAISFLSHLFEAAKSETVIGPTLVFLLPVAFAAMTLRLFSSMEITSFFVITHSLCLGWMTESPAVAIVSFVSSIAGASQMRHISQRHDVFKAGLIAGSVKAAMVLIIHELHFTSVAGLESGWFNNSMIVIFSLASGVFAALLVLGFQLLLEYVGYTTDLRLMELASTNHPLLRDLILKAPGTYFHSFTVSQLAEKAAEAIHANALFARVASLYHDIGKTKKPHYFIENIKGENKHDKLAPTMSALIIANHVKDGIELGIEHKLPPSIIEVIPQHHGTALISFFYDKAKKLSEESEESVDDRDFRYPGPKPQTREGAIILLADAVEATVKSLPNKSLDMIRQVVNQTIQRFFLDGQLDECELTLKDLNSIANAFLQVLQGVYHQRIEYPHAKEPSDEKTQSYVSKIKPIR